MIESEIHKKKFMKKKGIVEDGDVEYHSVGGLRMTSNVRNSARGSARYQPYSGPQQAQNSNFWGSSSKHQTQNNSVQQTNPPQPWANQHVAPRPAYQQPPVAAEVRSENDPFPYLLGM